ncbi:SDR family oxidoreductase [Psychrobacter sp. JB385]|uniref:SDR family oxidoreductase n=1 Tax=Psychrobacter sp. JB385 TaxID=1434841 RepID=UPI00097EAD6A|nr:SDR family oxidoreductase [Psychrobacter sp. JB385]SJN24370.1 Oxidoreductase, short-chain dehydrogenase/reductase family [Psychrobacter sp. JB385]
MTSSNQQSTSQSNPAQSTLSYTLLIGATGGIGQAIATQLCAHNQPVILVGRNAQTLTYLAKTLAKAYPDIPLLSLSCDLSSRASQIQLTAALRETVQDCGNVIDTVILNAGINDFALLTDQSDEIIEQMMLVNVAYPLQLIKRLLPMLMIQQSPSQIISIGSTFGSIGYPGFSAYSASKFALRGASEALGREYADTSVKFRYFAPRATKTTMNKNTVVAMNQALKVKMDSPETVAKALVSFISTTKSHQHLGFPERFFAWLNRLFPNVVGNAIVKDLPTIKKYAGKS